MYTLISPEHKCFCKDLCLISNASHENERRIEIDSPLHVYLQSLKQSSIYMTIFMLQHPTRWVAADKKGFLLNEEALKSLWSSGPQPFNWPNLAF